MLFKDNNAYTNEKNVFRETNQRKYLETILCKYLLCEQNHILLREFNY